MKRADSGASPAVDLRRGAKKRRPGHVGKSLPVTDEDSVRALLAELEAYHHEIEATRQLLDAERAAHRKSEEALRESNETLERRVAERTAVAEQQAAQLRALTSALSQAEQRERRRLAQVLHDQLQQILVAARFKVGVLHRRTEEEDMRELLDQLDEMLDQGIAESRFLTTELCPPVLHESGLAAALESLASQIHKRHGLTVEVQAEQDRVPLDEGMRVFLFHATREMLFNVVKHAQTERAWVRMARTGDGMLRVEIGDQGVGCDPARLEHHAGDDGGFGLFNLRARLEVFQGRLEVETAPGKGTRVAIFVPVQDDARGNAMAPDRNGP